MFGRARGEYPVGIDIGARGVGVVRLQTALSHGTQQVRVAATGWAPCSVHLDSQLRIHNLAEVRAAISLALAQAQVNKHAGAVLGLPTTIARAVRIRLPPMPDHEVAKAALFEAAAAVDFPVQQCQLKNLIRAGSGWVAEIVRAPAVRSRQELVERAMPGLKVKAVDYESAAWQRALPGLAGIYDARGAVRELIIFAPPADHIFHATPDQVGDVLVEQHMQLRKTGFDAPLVAMAGAERDLPMTTDVRIVRLAAALADERARDTLLAYGLAQWSLCAENAA